MRIGTISRLRILPVAALLFSGCLDTASDNGGLAESRAKWKSVEPELYAYTIHRNCFCLPSLVYVVANRDSVISATELMNGTVAGAHSFTEAPHKQAYAIDALFDELGSVLDRNYASRTVSYDPTYGFPDSVYIDFEANASDEEYSLVIRDLRPLSPSQPRDSLAILTVKGYQVPCHKMMARSCLEVSLDGRPFEPLPGIGGFVFRWGYETLLTAKVIQVPEGTEDAGPYEYESVEVLLSGKTDSTRFEILLYPGEAIDTVDGVLKIPGYGKDIALVPPLPFPMERGGRPYRLTVAMDENGRLILLSAQAGP